MNVEHCLLYSSYSVVIQEAGNKLSVVYKLVVMVYKVHAGIDWRIYGSVTSLASRRHLQSAESDCLTVTGTRTTLGTRNFAVTGPNIWNSLLL